MALAPGVARLGSPGPAVCQRGSNQRGYSLWTFHQQSDGGQEAELELAVHKCFREKTLIRSMVNMLVGMEV
jgi:hypothetical protein